MPAADIDNELLVCFTTAAESLGPRYIIGRRTLHHSQQQHKLQRARVYQHKGGITTVATDVPDPRKPLSQTPRNNGPKQQGPPTPPPTLLSAFSRFILFCIRMDDVLVGCCTKYSDISNKCLCVHVFSVSTRQN
jgi:hypothetical protein